VRFETTEIPGVVVFTPTPVADSRGFFSRTYDVEVAEAAGIDPYAFRQDSLSRSARGVIRALHVRTGQGEAKLVRCSSGRVYDVVVDLRPGSPTRGRWLSFELSGEEQTSVYIPAGCAHGFQALTDPADTSYRIDRPHDPSEALSIAYDDPQLAIPWPLPDPILSEADRAARPMSDLVEELERLPVFQQRS
jgi:dTDP-4-dehydrorhamnose 3,5-epimerase